ncbi:conserved hypothetical protein [Methylobacterium sp. 4-46]|uniref:DUF2721 domain-containing protein n=1 Tax=unclassified Methylobacterium TaxID=2615210 RepID=UPI000152CC8E|nr:MULTISPECIES: DUF2721 domain-containing protein [Methylobacterium]ACA15479.1 conserved hypothetical protein [Methylobacterium sp. 4-46]WFT81197.1 DUF2721 domain-containing protein [Methylobacterium nodulans]
MPVPADLSALDSTAHIIQVALTPVFLLSGLATLLSVLSTRHARIADQVERLSGRTNEVARLAELRRRSLALDAAVVLAALAGVATCGAVLTLFVGALRDTGVASVLFALFGAAIVFTLCALGVFAVEMTLASRDVRSAAATQAEEARER